MKRVAILFDAILERENLRLAFWKASKGKRDRHEVRAFAAQLEIQLKEMAGRLRSGDFPVGRFHQFIIRDPKERIITAPCLPERILHHAIMNVCEPYFERGLIADTYACRVGRGRLKALSRSMHFARRHAYYLKFDIRKYFDSISHETLLGSLHCRFKDRRLLGLFERIIQAYRGNVGKGLPIGSLTSQHFANFFLSWFDRFVKETLRIRGYVRYMDDMAIWSEDRGQLVKTLERCETFLREKLQLECKPTPYINRTSHGMDFLGVRVFPHHMVLNRASKRRFSRGLRQLEKNFEMGTIDESELQQCATAMAAYCRSGNISSWKFRQSVLSNQMENSQKARTG